MSPTKSRKNKTTRKALPALFVLRGRYTATLEPGDTVYVPVGALHGGHNLKDSGPAVALTSNFLDVAHAQQVLEEFCTYVKSCARATLHEWC